MIENLNGIFETVNFKKLPSIKVYHNNKFENYPLHWHTPIEIIMPINNWYDITCGDKTFRLEEYDIALITSGTLHKLTAPERGKRLIFQIDCSVFHAMKEPNTILSFLAPLTIITKKTYPTIHTQIIQILMSIHDEYFSNGTFTETFIYFKILEILVLLGKNYTESNTHFDVGISKQQEYAEKFLDICDYINAHYMEDLTLDFIADLAGFSKYHFTRLFKQFTKVSFYKFLNQKRILHAEQLLIHPEYTITEISIRSGFSSISAFNRMFKQIKGCTPSAFRNMYTPECTSRTECE